MATVFDDNAMKHNLFLMFLVLFGVAAKGSAPCFWHQQPCFPGSMNPDSLCPEEPKHERVHHANLGGLVEQVCEAFL